MVLVALKLWSSVLFLQTTAASSDTLHIRRAADPVAFDGAANSVEYGVPTLSIRTGQTSVSLWVVRHEGYVYIAADLPDSTYYWGDDLVVSLDPRGDDIAALKWDDTQWYIRRMTDSSQIFHGSPEGKWTAPRGDPDWRLGASRSGEGWELRSQSGAEGWSLELRLDEEWFAGERGRNPRIAFRTYDDQPHGWYVWPTRTGLKHPTEVERTPGWWALVM